MNWLVGLGVGIIGTAVVLVVIWWLTLPDTRTNRLVADVIQAARDQARDEEVAWLRDRITHLEAELSAARGDSHTMAMRFTPPDPEKVPPDSQQYDTPDIGIPDDRDDPEFPDWTDSMISGAPVIPFPNPPEEVG